MRYLYILVLFITSLGKLLGHPLDATFASPDFKNRTRLFLVEDLKSKSSMVLTGTIHLFEDPARRAQLRGLMSQSQRVYVELSEKARERPMDTLPEGPSIHHDLAKKVFVQFESRVKKQRSILAGCFSTKTPMGTEHMIDELFKDYPQVALIALESPKTRVEDLAQSFAEEFPKLTPSDLKPCEEAFQKVTTLNGKMQVQTGSLIHKVSTAFDRWITSRREARWVKSLKRDLELAAPKTNFLVAVGCAHIPRLCEAFKREQGRYRIREIGLRGALGVDAAEWK